MDKTKPFDIPKALVWKAFKLVKANKGSAGIDKESLDDFEQNLTQNLYKLCPSLIVPKPSVRQIDPNQSKNNIAVSFKNIPVFFS